MSTKFDLLYIDCPWSYHGSKTKDAAAGKHYDLMTQEDLKALPITDVLNKRAAVLMWATGPKLHYAIELLEAWGLHYRGVAFVWVKTRQDGAIIHGQGVPPTFTKPTTEFVLLATTKKTGRMIKLQKFNTPQVVLAPRGRHSEKPEVFRQHIEATFSPGFSKLEIFARKETPGWVCLGNEVGEKKDIRVSLEELCSNS